MNNVSATRPIQMLAIHRVHTPLANDPMFSALEQPGVGRYLMPGISLDFSAVARAPAAPTPTLGQHTEEVLPDVLRLSVAEFGRLDDKGIVAGPARC